jgi:hypothetical protein
VGLSLSADRRTALVTAFRTAAGTDLMLVEGFR